MVSSSSNSNPSHPWFSDHDNGKSGTLVFGRGDPKDLPLLFYMILNTEEGVNSFHRMIDSLGADGDRGLAIELHDLIAEQSLLPPVMVFTGVMEKYVEAGKTADALHVFRMMPDERHAAPNAYTYSVIIKALAVDKDPNFLEVAKELVMEMMGKGMQPNAKLYTAVFEAYARQDKMEEAKQFLEQMKANGFVVNKRAVRSIKLVREAKGPAVQTIIDTLFDKADEYSDESKDDSTVKNHTLLGDWSKYRADKLIPMAKNRTLLGDWSKYPADKLIPMAKRQVIDYDPENPKCLEQVFDKMRRNGPLIQTITKMLHMLIDDGFLSQVEDIMTAMKDECILEVVIHTGVIDYYGSQDEAKHALKVFVRMLSLGISPNAYTYSVLIKALAKDSNFLGDAKKYLLEMMDKGMQPNARTYTPVFKAFARLEDDNVKKGKEFLEEMRAMGFRANKKAVMEVLKDKKGPVVKTVNNILFGK